MDVISTGEFTPEKSLSVDTKTDFRQGDPSDDLPLLDEQKFRRAAIVT
jgi:hypothetical protein